MLKKKKNNKGFTLVELLVVIAIIGILAVVAVPSLFKNINKAKASDVVAYMSAIKTAAMSEYADNNKGGTFTEDVKKLVEDAPKDVNLTSVVVDTNGVCTITATLDNSDIVAQVEKQMPDTENTKLVLTPKPAESN